MRTTLTLDDDLADSLIRISRERHVSFKVVLNEAVRRGLADHTPPLPPFDYQPHEGKLLPGIDNRRLNELAFELEEDRFTK